MRRRSTGAMWQFRPIGVDHGCRAELVRRVESQDGRREVTQALIAGGLMPRPILIVLTFAASLARTDGAAAQTTKNDYGDAKTWLCRPGRQDACAVDQTTTIVAADGTLTRETWKPTPTRRSTASTCIPTVSTDPTPNSDMTPEPAENDVVRAQFARFASQCRVYAPLYRQVTLAALARLRRPAARCTLDRALAYNDVVDAWNHYLRARQQGPRRRADRPLAGLGSCYAADSQRDRRQAGAVEDRLGAPARHQPRRCRRARTSAARSRTCRSAIRRRRRAA